MKPGDKVKLKTLEQLLRDGWIVMTNGMNRGSGGYYINNSMKEYLGRIVTIRMVMRSGEILLIQEDTQGWHWYGCLFDLNPRKARNLPAWF